MTVLRRSFLQCAAAAAAMMPKPVFAEMAGLRIVSLDYGLSSTLLSLGLPPVGISDLADWGRWVVEPVLPSSVIDIGSANEINFEILVQLKPDIILTTPYLNELLSRLQPFAKVVRLEVFTPGAGPILPAAIAATRRLAAEIGRQNEAERFLAHSDAFFESCRNRLSGRKLPPVALVNFMDARHARIYSAPGLFHNALERIGVRNAWEKQSNYWGFETIGIEGLSAIKDPDARLIAFDPIPPDVLPRLATPSIFPARTFFRSSTGPDVRHGERGRALRRSVD